MLKIKSPQLTQEFLHVSQRHPAFVRTFASTNVILQKVQLLTKKIENRHVVHKGFAGFDVTILMRHPFQDDDA
jgi:hypothetical protein